MSSCYGEIAYLRYRYPDGRVQAVLPMHTVTDDGETFVGWTPPDSRIMYWADTDGGDPRALPLDRRFRTTLTTAPRRWQGNGVLRVIPGRLSTRSCTSGPRRVSSAGT